jgi:penicillin-binding protein 2
MQGVMEFGTGAAAKVPGVVVCGKTGTVQNFYKGKAQKDHAFFGAFAPRNNPKIAIAVMCENAGFGAASAAPIASLMIEKYLKDSIAGPERQAEVEEIAKRNLIPARMKEEMARMDSIKLAKENQLLQKEREGTDTTGIEDGTDQEIKIPVPKPVKSKAPKYKDTGVAILMNEEKKHRKHPDYHL